MSETPMRGFRVARDEGRFAENLGVGIGAGTFKVLSQDSSGSLLAFEQVHQAKGGPARHLHHEQDEWFYVVEGEYVIEVGEERFQMKPGDSAFAPRRVPHAWAFVGDRSGRMLFILTPAGQLEAFLREISKANAMAPQDPAFWPRYGM